MDKKIRLLWLVPSGSIEAVNKKFGNLDILFQDRISGLSSFNIRFCPTGETNKMVKISEDFYFYQIHINHGVLRLMMTFIMVFYLTLRYRINILRSSTPFHYALPMLAGAKILRKPFCVSIHADYDEYNKIERTHNRFKNQVSRMWLKLFVPRIKYILYVIPTYKNFALKYGARKENSYYFPHGVSPDEFKIEDRMIFRDKYFPNSDFQLLYVGRIKKEKMVFDIIKIGKEILNKKLNVLINIVGDGEDREELLKEIKTYNLSNIISYWGSMDNIQVKNMMVASDAVFVPVGGYTYIEAAMSATPVISYVDKQGYQFLQKNHSGFGVKSGDFHSIIKCIEFLLRSPDEGRVKGLRAREIAIKLHSTEIVNYQKKEIYEKILDKRINFS